MYKKIILIPLIILIYSLMCKNIYTTYSSHNNKTIKTYIETKINKAIKKDNDESIGKLIIKKINLEEKLYDKISTHNNIEEHVTILDHSTEPSNENSIVFLAAHSGTGKIAYFERLDELTLNDEITLIYKNKTYIYIVKDIIELKKIGTIRINKTQEKQLVLTTCSPNKENYQLIINCTITKELPK